MFVCFGKQDKVLYLGDTNHLQLCTLTQLNRPFQAPVWLAINPFINLYMTLKQKQVQIMPSLRTGQHRTDGGVCVCVCGRERLFKL